MLLLSFDPGETTGFVAAKLTPHLKPQLMFLENAAIPFDHFYGELYQMVRTWRVRFGFEDDVVVICEEFRLYPNRAQAQIGSNFPTVRVIGAIEYVCQTEFQIEPTLRMRSTIERITLPSEVKEWCDRTHTRDAAAHIFRFGIDYCRVDFRRDGCFDIRW